MQKNCYEIEGKRKETSLDIDSNFIKFFSNIMLSIFTTYITNKNNVTTIKNNIIKYKNQTKIKILIRQFSNISNISNIKTGIVF